MTASTSTNAVSTPGAAGAPDTPGAEASPPPSLQMFDLGGRTALVTGSSAGIGYGIARALGHAGATLVLNGRDPQRLAAAAAALRGEGLRVHQHGFDVTDRDAVLAAIEVIERDVGAIDILVNNA